MGYFTNESGRGGVWCEENAECLLNVQRLRMHRLANMQNLQVSMLTLKIPTTEKIHHSKYKHKYIKLVQHAIIIDINIFFRKSFRYYC